MVEQLIEEMKQYADENNVPIITDEGISYIKKYIETHNIKNILEIGAAIGYSSIRMALINNKYVICSITVSGFEIPPAKNTFQIASILFLVSVSIFYLILFYF